MKKKSLLFIFLGVFLVLVVVILYSINVFKNSGVNINVPLIYVNSDGQMKYLTFGNQTSQTIIGNVSTNSVLYAYPFKKEDKFTILVNNNLYLVDKNHLNKNMKIINKFDNYMRNNDYFIYILDQELYSLDIEKNIKTKVAYNVTDIHNVSDKYYVYLQNGVEYLGVFGAENQKIRLGNFSGINGLITSNVISISDKSNRILYYSDNDDNTKNLVLYDIKQGKKIKEVERCYSVEYYSEDLSKIAYSLVNETKKMSEYILTYTEEEQKYLDQLRQFYKDVKEKKYGYCYSNYEKGNHCYYDSETMTRYLVPNYLYDMYQRDQLINNTYNYDVPQLNVYFLENEKEDLLAENVHSGIMVMENKDISFSLINDEHKTNPNSFTECTSVYNCKEGEELFNNVKYDIYYKEYNKEKKLIDKDLNGSSGIVKINHDLVLSIYKEENSTRSYIKLAKNPSGDLEKKETIVENGIIMEDQYNKKNNLYWENYNYQENTGDLYYYRDGKKVHIANDIFVNSYFYLDNVIYFIENYNTSSTSGTLVRYDIGNGIKINILEDVYKFLYVNKNQFFILKNYSASADSFDLYSYDNGKLKTIEYSVSGVNELNFLNHSK